MANKEKAVQLKNLNLVPSAEFLSLSFEDLFLLPVYASQLPKDMSLTLNALEAQTDRHTYDSFLDLGYYALSTVPVNKNIELEYKGADNSMLQLNFYTQGLHDLESASCYSEFA